MNTEIRSLVLHAQKKKEENRSAPTVTPGSEWIRSSLRGMNLCWSLMTRVDEGTEGQSIYRSVTTTRWLIQSIKFLYNWKRILQYKDFTIVSSCNYISHPLNLTPDGLSWYDNSFLSGSTANSTDEGVTSRGMTGDRQSSQHWSSSTKHTHTPFDLYRQKCQRIFNHFGKEGFFRSTLEWYIFVYSRPNNPPYPYPSRTHRGTKGERNWVLRVGTSGSQ